MTTIEATCCYWLRGEVDLASAAQLETDLDRFASGTEGTVVVDCAGLSFIDSSGIAALVHVDRALRKVDRRLRLLHLQATPRRVIEIMGLTEILGVAA